MSPSIPSIVCVTWLQSECTCHHMLIFLTWCNFIESCSCRDIDHVLECQHLNSQSTSVFCPHFYFNCPVSPFLMLDHQGATEEITVGCTRVADQMMDCIWWGRERKRYQAWIQDSWPTVLFYWFIQWVQKHKEDQIWGEEGDTTSLNSVRQS